MRLNTTEKNKEQVDFVHKSNQHLIIESRSNLTFGLTWDQAQFSGSHTFTVTATAKPGPDTNSYKFVLTAARFWLQRWLAVGTMPQDLIGCWNQRKLKALIPRVVAFVNDPPSVERRVDFAVFFIVLWSYSRKICLNMCHGKSETHMVIHIFLGFALFTELYSGVESLCKFSVDH